MHLERLLMYGVNPSLHFPNSYLVCPTLLKSSTSFPYCFVMSPFLLLNFHIYLSLFLGILFCIIGMSA